MFVFLFSFHIYIRRVINNFIICYENVPKPKKKKKSKLIYIQEISEIFFWQHEKNACEYYYKIFSKKICKFFGFFVLTSHPILPTTFLQLPAYYYAYKIHNLVLYSVKYIIFYQRYIDGIHTLNLSSLLLAIIRSKSDLKDFKINLIFNSIDIVISYLLIQILRF